jgi:protein SCO1
MNRSVLILLAIVSFLTGTATFLLGSRYIEGLRDSKDEIIGRAGGSAQNSDRSYLVVPPEGKADWLTDFTLTERSGKPARWSDLNGKVRVTSFFFSACPSICLQQNQKVREIQRGYDGKEVVFLSITCDPETDSPERLREYASKLEADPSQWLFLTGDLIYIRRIAGEMFSVPLDKQTHSEKLLVSDKWGNRRGAFHWNKLNEVTQLKLLVDKLLAESEEPAEFREKKAAAEPGPQPDETLGPAEPAEAN